MSKAQGRQPRHVKTVNLALQGGGSHGAFTWGVLDRIFEDGRVWIEAISGASAGAMNAVVAAQGMYDGGGEGAREALHAFWRKVAEAALFSPYQRTPWDKAAGRWSLEGSPLYLAMDLLGRVASPYDLNPAGVNPLKDLVGGFVDFDKVRDCEDMPIFISATNVDTGHARVVDRQSITLDAVMASACLPFMFHAVEIDGKPYAFIGLERVGGIMVYDVTDPNAVTFEEYINPRDFSIDDSTLQDAVEAAAGTLSGDLGSLDLGPAGLLFIDAADSPLAAQYCSPPKAMAAFW